MPHSSNTKVEVNAAPTPKKDFWDILNILMIPLFVSVLMIFIGWMQKNDELEVRYLELAIKILNTKSTETSAPVRDWAFDYFSEHSGYKDSLDKAKKEILKQPLIADMSKIVQDTVSISVGMGADFGTDKLYIGGTSDLAFDVEVSTLSLIPKRFPTCAKLFHIEKSYYGKSSAFISSIEYNQLTECLKRENPSIGDKKLENVTSDIASVVSADANEVFIVECKALVSSLESQHDQTNYKCNDLAFVFN